MKLITPVTSLVCYSAGIGLAVLSGQIAQQNTTVLAICGSVALGLLVLGVVCEVITVRAYRRKGDAQQREEIRKFTAALEELERPYDKERD